MSDKDENDCVIVEPPLQTRLKCRFPPEAHHACPRKHLVDVSQESQMLRMVGDMLSFSFWFLVFSDAGCCTVSTVYLT